MKRFKTPIPLLLSLVVHAVIIGLVVVLNSPPRPTYRRTISFDLREDAVQVPQSPRIREPDMPEIPREELAFDESVPSSVPEAAPRTVVLDPIADFDTLYQHARLINDSTSVFDQDAWKETILDFLRREKLLTVDVPAEPDSTRLTFSPGEFTIPPAARDGIADMLNRRSGTSPQVSATELIAGLARAVGRKETPPRFDFLPSRVQVASLAHLYENRNATQMDIYTATDGYATTAEHLERNLDHLVKKGWLKKKKVSPENILSFFGIPIEMSRKNALNPLYIYEPQVDRSTLITYLQSRLYLIKEQARTPEDSLRIRPRIDSLNRQIQALIPG